MQCVEHVAARRIATLRVQKPENAPFLPSENRFFEGVAELPLLKLLRIEYFEHKYDFSFLIRIFNSQRLKIRQI